MLRIKLWKYKPSFVYLSRLTAWSRLERVKARFYNDFDCMFWVQLPPSSRYCILEHGRRQWGAEGTWVLWIFIHDTDKAEGGLMVLFFDLVFFRCLPLKIFLPTPLSSNKTFYDSYLFQCLETSNKQQINWKEVKEANG